MVKKKCLYIFIYDLFISFRLMIYITRVTIQK